MAEIASQATDEPTNKLAVGARTAAGAAGVIATAVVMFGEPALRELIAAGPAWLNKPGITAAIIGTILLLASYFGGSKMGKSVGWYIPDAPNIPLAPVDQAPPPVIVAAPVVAAPAPWPPMINPTPAGAKPYQPAYPDSGQTSAAESKPILPIATS